MLVEARLLGRDLGSLGRAGVGGAGQVLRVAEAGPGDVALAAPCAGLVRA